MRSPGILGTSGRTLPWGGAQLSRTLTSGGEELGMTTRRITAAAVIMILLILPSAGFGGVLDVSVGGISGRILDPDGSPLEWGRATAIDAAGEDVQTVEADADGVYLIRNLVPGEYRVRFDSPYLTRWHVPFRYEPIWYEDATSVADARPVRVTTGAVTSKIDGRLHSGTVIRGSVNTPQGDPIADARIEAIGSDGTMFWDQSGGDGSYEIYVAAATYRVVAQSSARDEYGRHLYGWAWHGGGTGISVTVSRSSRLDNIDVVLTYVPRPGAIGRAAAVILKSAEGQQSLNDTGQQSVYTCWDTPATFDARLETGCVDPRWVGRVTSSATVGRVWIAYGGYSVVHASATSDCIFGVHSEVSIDPIGYTSLPQPIEPNTELIVDGNRITLNYQRIISPYDIEVAAVRVVEANGRESLHGYARSRLTGCP